MKRVAAETKDMQDSTVMAVRPLRSDEGRGLSDRPPIDRSPSSMV